MGDLMTRTSAALVQRGRFDSPFFRSKFRVPDGARSTSCTGPG